MRYAQLAKNFSDTFGESSDIRIFFAPGRVNLIGDHTDYNGGYVFPAALTVGTWALIRPREDGIFRFASTHFPQQVTCSLEEIHYRPEDDWANYPKGVIHQFLQLPNAPFKGADILYHGTIPTGAGLSSSASIEVVTAFALSEIWQRELPLIELIQLAQRAESQFLGVQCGIMDQFTVGMGKADNAILLKCDTLAFDYIPVRIDGYTFIITHTKKRRTLTDSKYNERHGECTQAWEQIQHHYPQLSSLGDLQLSDWKRIQNTLSSHTLRHRVEHVISENHRVLQAAECLQKNDLDSFGQLMKASHESLRDHYKVTGVELDTLFEEASRVEGCLGTRMTGAGFGGCTISLVKDEAIPAFQHQVSEHYQKRTHLTPEFYLCKIGDGVKEIIEGGAS